MIDDFCSRVRRCIDDGQTVFVNPHSQELLAFLKVLKKDGFVERYETITSPQGLRIAVQIATTPSVIVGDEEYNFGDGVYCRYLRLQGAKPPSKDDYIPYIDARSKRRRRESGSNRTL